MVKVHRFKLATTLKNVVEFELCKGPIYVATTIIQGGILVPNWKKIIVHV